MYRLLLCPTVAQRNPMATRIGSRARYRFDGTISDDAGRSGEGADSFGESSEHGAIEAVPCPHIGSECADHAGIPENAEVIRDRRLGERQLGSDVPNGAWTADVEEFENLKTYRVSKRFGNRSGLNSGQ